MTKFMVIQNVQTVVIKFYILLQQELERDTPQYFILFILILTYHMHIYN